MQFDILLEQIDISSHICLAINNCKHIILGVVNTYDAFNGEVLLQKKLQFSLIACSYRNLCTSLVGDKHVCLHVMRYRKVMKQATKQNKTMQWRCSLKDSKDIRGIMYFFRFTQQILCHFL